MFHNGGEFARLYPGDTGPAWQFCAPRLEAGSPELAAIHAALAERAEALGYRLTNDPDLHLIVDGEIVRPASVAGYVHRFVIPAGSAAVWLASRSAIPAEAVAAERDIRRLGVPLERIGLHDADLSIEAWHSHAALCEGFHDDECSLRWTDGLGRVPEVLLRGFAADVMIAVHLAPSSLRYCLEPLASARAA